MILVALLLFAPAVEARVGGGHSYGGHSGSGGGGGGGGDGGLIWLVFRVLIELTFDYPLVGIPIDLAVLALVVYWWNNTQANRATNANFSTQGSREDLRPRRAVDDKVWDGLREHDPNFSQVLFTDFTYALYAAVQEARGRNQLDNFAPYLAANVLEQLRQRGGAGLEGVRGVIVAGSRVIKVSDPNRPRVAVTVEFEANYTETTAADASTTWYVREQWMFVRARDVLSRPPETITALHCPKCGGALETGPDGACRHCGVKAAGGAFDWFVTQVRVLECEDKGPLLTQTVPEEGTDRRTVYQPDFAAVRERFQAHNPDFTWPRFTERAKHIFFALQAAWSDRQWERARPFVSDQMFQTQLYWITEYQRQHLRNVLKDVRIERVEPVKVSMDAFYDALTVRIFAGMIDYTADEQGKVVCGSKNDRRDFSEYWTFIRRRGAKPAGKGDANCPNCGAPLKVNMAGVCEYCQGKITRGDFDWVLSRIEQDEAYQG